MQAAVNNIEDFISTKDDNNCNLPEKLETPLQTSYCPELDVSPELGPNEVEYYISLIGMMRRMV